MVNTQQEFNHKKNGFSKLLNYKEDKLDDIDELSTPIELLVDISDLNNNKNEKDSTKFSNSTSLKTLNLMGSSFNAEQATKDYDIIGTLQQASNVISRSSTPSVIAESTESTVEPIQDMYHSKQYPLAMRSKKKLSFADYKKKLNK